MDVESDNWIIPQSVERQYVDLKDLSKVTGNFLTLSKAKNELGWVPEISAQTMCEEMIAHDLTRARQHALLQQHGFVPHVSVE